MLHGRVKNKDVLMQPRCQHRLWIEPVDDAVPISLYDSNLLRKAAFLMRKTLALFAAGCALVGAVAVQAQNLPISGVTSSPSPFSFTPGVGGLFTFSGTITNNTTTTIEGGLPGLALTNPVPTDVTFDTSNFTAAFGIPPIVPGGTYVGELFQINIGPGQLTGFDVRFEVEGLDASGASVRGATGVFEITAGVNAAVPEPGSVALLIGAGITGLMLRRRRK
jgi:hypothetical protein